MRNSLIHSLSAKKKRVDMGRKAQWPRIGTIRFRMVHFHKLNALFYFMHIQTHTNIYLFDKFSRTLLVPGIIIRLSFGLYPNPFVP